jgi:hypothetical protein
MPDIIDLLTHEHQLSPAAKQALQELIMLTDEEFDAVLKASKIFR